MLQALASSKWSKCDVVNVLNTPLKRYGHTARAVTVYSENARAGALFLKRDLKTVVILNASQVVIARYV